ncbi:Eco57I restriction-modification methylase domain-containing protein, partial [Thiolapillus sp.]
MTEADLKNASSEEELRNKASLPGVPLEYLRFVQIEDDAGDTQWQPAAGAFDAWPEQLGDLKTLDPCCGSGHFLVAAFLMLVPMRMELEGLSAHEVVDAVLRENLHGLEIDQRCVELAAFALALTAWKYPNLPSPSGRGVGGEGAIGYRPLPELNLACSGLSVSVAKEEWKQLGLGKKNLTIALDWMHDTFKDAPVLGSLLNPAKTDAAKLVHWDEFSQTLEHALSLSSPSGRGAGGEGCEQQEATVVAQGLAKAATLLAGQYQWVITNVPYLARGKQNQRLREFCERHYPAAKNDLATVFLDRCLEFCSLPSPSGRGAGGEGAIGGTVSVVLPQNWLFLTSYKKFREKLLQQDTWHLIARLGEGGFDSSAAAGAFVAMI